MESKKVDVPCKVNGGIYAALFSAATMFSVSGIVFEMPLLTLIGILNGAAVVIVMSMNRGKCWADSNGIVIKMPFKKSRLIPYCDIKTAYISLNNATNSQEETKQAGVYQTLYIVTKSGNISFMIKEGRLCSSADLYNDLERAAIIERSPFAEIVSMVKANCGEDPLEGYLYR
jgi:hypothetical protein